ncbi:MAG: DUF1273 family protein [Clostridia bacterium]|nr:DUF1273 family protein [Clostridia bacterium]
MKKSSCCFSGHRIIPPTKYEVIKHKLLYEIEKLAKLGVHSFKSGGAMGFDLLAAECVLEIKKHFPEIKLIMVYPFPEQAKLWNDSYIKKYNYIKAHCDEFVYVNPCYSKAAIFKRNRLLVNESNYCICYLTKPNGGTAYTVKEAYENGLSIINLA